MHTELGVEVSTLQVSFIASKHTQHNIYISFTHIHKQNFEYMIDHPGGGGRDADILFYHI